MLPLCTPTKRGFTRDEGAPVLVQKYWDLSAGAMQGMHQSRAKAKSLQGQAGSPAASWEATVQLHGATLDPRVHIQTASRAYILFLDLALCQNHRVQCLHGLQREDTKCDLAQAVTTIYCQHLSQILLPRVKMFTCPLILNGPGCMSNANERDSWSI